MRRGLRKTDKSGVNDSSTDGERNTILSQNDAPLTPGEILDTTNTRVPYGPYNLGDSKKGR